MEIATIVLISFVSLGVFISTLYGSKYIEARTKQIEAQTKAIEADSNFRWGLSSGTIK
jgi:hypothetical protein